MAGATVTVISIRLGRYGVLAALAAATVCFLIRMLGVRFDLNAPRPPGDDGDD